MPQQTLQNYTLPFGKYKGKLLKDVSTDYLLWFISRAKPGKDGTVNFRLEMIKKEIEKRK